MKENIKPATGRLGVLVVGVGGAVATTMITGTLAARKGLAKAIGSITQMAAMRMQDGKEKLIKDIVPLADLNDIIFGGWDIFPDNAYEAAMYAEVLKEKDLNLVKDELQAIKPMPAAFDHNFAKRLNGTHIKKAATRWEMTEQLREDIRNFKAANNCERIAVLWAASTEIYIPLSKEHESLAALEQAMKENNTEVISPSMCYAYAALSEGCPFIMGAPNTTVDIPAMWELAEKTKMPIAGKDFKTGQTLVKSGFAPIIGTRCLGLDGWFSTNILGNRDGLVLDEPANFHTKEVSKNLPLISGIVKVPFTNIILLTLPVSFTSGATTLMKGSALTPAVNHIPRIRLPTLLIQLPRQFQIHFYLTSPNFTIHTLQLIQQSLPVRPLLPRFRLLQQNPHHPKSWCKHNFSVKTIRQNLRSLTPIQCLHQIFLPSFSFHINIQLHLTSFNNLPIQLHQTLTALTLSPTRCIRSQPSPNLRLQNRTAIFHLYTFTFSDKPHPSHKKPPMPSNQLSKIFHFKCICRELRYS